MQSAGDDMILVDSTVTINVPPEPAASTSPAPVSAQQSSKLGALAKAGVAAALIGSGAGAAVGIPLGMSALKDLLTPQPAATAPAAPDSTGGVTTSPRYLLELGKPE